MRSYLVGLPVVVTVHEDGRVSYDVDTAEASDAIHDADSGYTDTEVIADARAIDADNARRVWDSVTAQRPGVPVEALCLMCRETFLPDGPWDLEHFTREDGTPCGGNGVIVGAQ